MREEQFGKWNRTMTQFRKGSHPEIKSVSVWPLSVGGFTELAQLDWVRGAVP